MLVLPALGDISTFGRYCSLTQGQYPSSPVGMLISYQNVYGQLQTIELLESLGLLRWKFLDCGAYTLNSGCRKPPPRIRFDPYVRFVLRYGRVFPWISAFDQDFLNPKLNQTLYLRMRDILAGTELVDRIVPVVHDYNAVQEFDLYRKMGARRIAIGSKPRIPPDQCRRINRIRLTHGTEIHLFGNLRMDELLRWIPQSVDSANYAHAGTYQEVLWWDPERQWLGAVPLRGPDSLSDAQQAVVFQRLGLTATDLLNVAPNRQLVGINAMHELQVFMTEYAKHNRLPV